MKCGFFGPMKGLETAKHGVEALPDGRLRAWIEHDVMKGVEPEMLRWWFEHVDETTTFNGRDFNGAPVPVYRYWHPFDHIAVRWKKRVTAPDGRLGPGSVISIRENLGGRHPVAANARVTRFDDGAFNFDLLAPGGLAVGSLDHLYAAAPDGSSFYTEARIGFSLPGLRAVLNPLVRRFGFSEELIRDWVLHNIEESGETEKFVPALYAHAKGRS